MREESNPLEVDDLKMNSTLIGARDIYKQKTVSKLHGNRYYRLEYP